MNGYILIPAEPPKRSLYRQIIEDFLNSPHKAVRVEVEGKKPENVYIGLRLIIKRDNIKGVKVMKKCNLLYLVKTEEADDSTVIQKAIDTVASEGGVVLVGGRRSRDR